MLAAGLIAAAQLAGDRSRLDHLKAVAIQDMRAAVRQDVLTVKAQLSAAANLGIDPDDLSPVRGDLQAIERDATVIASLPGLSQLSNRAESLTVRLKTLEDNLSAEKAAVQQAAVSLAAQYQGRLDAMRAAGLSALTDGRNEATVGAFLKIPAVARASRALEHYSALVSDTDPSQVALGVAGVQRYGQRVHEALVNGAPPKMIVISVAGQRLRAYERGKVVEETLVTTGRPELPTDIGPMQVTKKSSPWTMQSPWPKGSPFWYPDTVVQMVLWFTNTGEGIHDAAWEPASAYGPGSTTGPYASHGCIHVTAAAETFLYNWAELGTPVIVYPGDGSPAADQVAKQTVNAQGEPVDNHQSGI